MSTCKCNGKKMKIVSKSGGGNPWVMLKNDSPDKLSRLMHGCFDDQFIVFEGLNADRRIVMYDKKTETVETLRSQSAPSHFDERGIILNGVLYKFPFIGSSEAKIFRLSLSQGSKWEQVECILPFRPHPYSGVIHDDQFIYFFDLSMNTVMTMHRYDPETDQLTKVFALPVVDSDLTGVDFGAAVIAGKMYLRGISISRDKDKSDAPQKMHVLDLATQTWSSAPSLPKRIICCNTSTAANRWIIVHKGCRFMDMENIERNFKLFVFDTWSQQWTESTIDSPQLNEYEYVTLGSQLVAVETSEPFRMQGIEMKQIISDWTYTHMKHFILLRKLVDEGRAIPIVVTKKQKKEITATATATDNLYQDSDKAIHKLFTGIGLDLFRNVLSFVKY